MRWLHLLLCACALSACAAAPRTGAERAPAHDPAPALAPGEYRIRSADGVELYAKVAGHGPVCLFVHGGPGQGARSFEKMGGDALENGLTLVYLDQRGSGQSQDATDYHLRRVVDDFEDVRKRLGVERWCVIAHSFGGILALDYARRYPERVSALVMSNISLDFLGDAQRRMQIAFVADTLGDPALGVAADADHATVVAAHDRARAAMMRSGNGYRFLSDDKATVRAMSAIDDGYTRSIGYGTAVITQPAAWPEYYRDYAPETAEVRAPTLVISGDRDHAVGPEHYRTFRFPQQRVVRLDSGHLPYYENNAAFVAAIHAFLLPEPRR